MSDRFASAVDVIDVSYEDLKNSAHLTEAIRQAFGAEGLGILTVSGVPGYTEMRQALLPQAANFAMLPEAVQSRYEDPGSSYNFGWSHGKEALQDGKLDILKASFYANPMEDNPALVRSEGDVEKAAQLAVQHPSYFRPNIWPDADLPELEPVFKALGQLICAVGSLLMGHCDRFVSGHSQSPALGGKLSSILHRSHNHKARLLHYFPTAATATTQTATATSASVSGAGSSTDAVVSNSIAGGAINHTSPDLLEDSHAAADASNWCGWHTDHGSLTGLTSAMYSLNGVEISNPAPTTSGLYVRDRAGSTVRIGIPPGSLAFQVGEALQIHSGGLLRATPHCVRAATGPAAAGVSRDTFAVFMQPDVHEAMEPPPGVSPEQVAVGQYQPGMDFGAFSTATFQRYYAKAPQGS